jgi:N-acetylglucosaminyldiphosphoundecaprenol N-acetyl-beta-D-mannosaminyltransferase
MGKETRADILGCHVDLLDFNGVIEKIKSFIAGQLPRQVITLNAEIVYAASSNRDLQEIINKADLVTPDGIGIVWGARQLGYQVKERVTGIDLLHRLCREAAAAGWRIYLFGAAPVWLNWQHPNWPGYIRVCR